MTEKTAEIHNLIKTVATLHYFPVSSCLEASLSLHNKVFYLLFVQLCAGLSGTATAYGSTGTFSFNFLVFLSRNFHL